MAFTRFHDDPARILKQLQESTGEGRYMLNVPGNDGDRPAYMEDPFIRLQKSGGNRMTQPTNIESRLMGLGRTLDRDLTLFRKDSPLPLNVEKITYHTKQPITDQTRSTHPAWLLRDLDVSHERWAPLPLDPQANVNIPFNNYQSTRILEKDRFVAQAPEPFRLS
jgi:hypothetical protein